MKYRVMGALALAAAAFGMARGAEAAAGLCMTSPIAQFDGSGRMSPDGKYLAVGGRLLSLPDLRELGRVPEYGQFTADSRLYYSWQQNSHSDGIDIVDVAAPGTPRHVSYVTTLYVEVSPLGKFVLVHPGKRSVANPQALGGTDDYYSWRLVRTADGAEIAHSDNVYESYRFAVDASEAHALIYAYSDHPTANFLATVDLASGQVRELRANFGGGSGGTIAISADGRVAAVDSFDADHATFYDVASGNQLGGVNAKGGLLEASGDSNWFFVGQELSPSMVMAVRTGNWSSPVAVPALNGIAEYMQAVPGGMLAYDSHNGQIALIDGNLQRRFARPLGDRSWETPASGPVVSAQGEIVVWASRYNDSPSDGANGLSAFAVLDGRSGSVLCLREAQPPNSFAIAGVSATQIAIVEEGDKPPYKRKLALYAVEDEAAARARVQREALDAKAQSAKLPAAKKGEAQAMFKQAFELFQAGEFAAAVKLFGSGLAIDPGNPTANYYLGETYARLKDNSEAALYYARTVAIAPNTKEGALAATRLGN